MVYTMYTRMQATAKNYEIHADTRYFRKPCNNERPRYDVAWLRVWLFNSLTRKIVV